MDRLFLQNNANNANNDELMRNQQISQDKITELLEKSAESLLCGPSCQKQKVSEELKQKYLDAQTNVKMAPEELEQTKKNYYIFAEGRPYYDNMKEKELTDNATQLGQLITDHFKDEVNSAKTMVSQYNIALVNSSYTTELLDYYTNQNKELRVKLRNNHGDILTNDRKTFYETQELDRLERWYKIWYRTFYVLVLVFNICWLVCPSSITWPFKLILSLLFLFYPWYIDYVLRYFYSLFMDIHGSLPKNVYNSL